MSDQQFPPPKKVAVPFQTSFNSQFPSVINPQGAFSTSSFYNIPPEVKQKFPQLVTLILEAESMNDNERNYWFRTLPIMSDAQIKHLENILITEKTKLKNFDQKYQKQVLEISQNQIKSWETYKQKQKSDIRKLAEKEEQKKSQAESEALLSQLQDL